MEATIVRVRTNHKGYGGIAPCGPCGILDKEAYLLARFETVALPDGFVPGRSISSTLDKIRHRYTNYDELLEDLELLCIRHVTSGGVCAFAQDLVLGTDDQLHHGMISCTPLASRPPLTMAGQHIRTGAVAGLVGIWVTRSPVTRGYRLRRRGQWGGRWVAWRASANRRPFAC